MITVKGITPPLEELDMLSRDLHAWSRDKGFWDFPNSTEGLLSVDLDDLQNFLFATKYALIHSEISEAWEGWQAQNYENLKEELTDIIIRALDCLGVVRWRGFTIINMDKLIKELPEVNVGIECQLLTLHKMTSAGLESLRVDGVNTMSTHLVWIILYTIAVMDIYGWGDWQTMVREKMRINRGRPHKHGKAF